MTQIAVIGAGNMARLLICALKAAGARVLVIGRNAERLRLATAAGADDVIDLSREPDAVAAVRRRTAGHRGADGVIEAVGKPETWSVSVAMVRKGGRVCLFGGCAAGAKVELETHRIHYNEIALFGVFHLYVLIGGDVSRRRLVRVDVAGSRRRHAARLAWTRRVVAR